MQSKPLFGDKSSTDSAMHALGTHYAGISPWWYALAVVLLFAIIIAILALRRPDMRFEKPSDPPPSNNDVPRWGAD